GIWSTGNHSPPKAAISMVLRPVIGCTLSGLATYPMTRPIAAKGRAPSQDTRATVTHWVTLRWTWPTAMPVMNTTTSGGIANSRLRITLLTTYACGFSGGGRSGRFQPPSRSVAITPPLLIEADIEPNIAILTIT